MVVDDRPDTAEALPVVLPRGLDVHVLRCGGRGPAAARNLAWRSSDAAFIAFLDDDVVPGTDWATALADDLSDLPLHVAGSQGQINVPLPEGRAPTDAERNVAGLEAAWFATADLAYRRDALFAAGGFDERFPRAYREDAELALRLHRRGLVVRRGSRTISHPVGRARWHASLARQRGNADDVLVARVHGSQWRRDAVAPAGRLRRHAAITAAGAAAIVAAAMGRRRLAQALAAGSALGVAEFAVARIGPGPRTAPEVGAMVATSVALPPLAVAWHVAGRQRHRGAAPWPSTLDLVLLDRDGTLIEDVPYNGDPDRVTPLPGVLEGLDRLRSAGVRLGLVTNQSGVARGLLTSEQVAAVNARVVELLGPFDTIQICEHGPDDGCDCRKPAPGMVLAALTELGVAPERAALIGDIGADVTAARVAGVRAVLVPRQETLPAEVQAAPQVAPEFAAAVGLLLERPA
jgi:histidinol-phosphate phosphatase family protein